MEGQDAPGRPCHPRGLIGHLGGVIMARGTAERNAWTIQQIMIDRSYRCLDVGCTPDGPVTGIDTSPLMLKQASKRNAPLIQR